MRASELRWFGRGGWWRQPGRPSPTPASSATPNLSVSPSRLNPGTRSEDRHLGKWPTCQHRTCAGVRARVGRRVHGLGVLRWETLSPFLLPILRSDKVPCFLLRASGKGGRRQGAGRGAEERSPYGFGSETLSGLQQEEATAAPRALAASSAGRWRRTLVLLRRMEATS